MPDPLTPEQRRTLRLGRALKGIRQSDGFAALEEHLKAKVDATTRAWLTGENGPSKDYCRGMMEGLESIVADVDNLIGQAEDIAEFQQDLASSPLAPFSGRGDLAS